MRDREFLWYLRLGANTIFAQDETHRLWFHLNLSHPATGCRHSLSRILPSTARRAAAGERSCDGTLPGNQRTISQWFDTWCFVPQPLFTAGNSRRNILSSPGFKNLDVSIFKSFTVTERTRLQFRTEFFNTLNHPNFGLPQNALRAGDFGAISNTGNSTGRQIQFARKLLF